MSLFWTLSRNTLSFAKRKRRHNLPKNDRMFLIYTWLHSPVCAIVHGSSLLSLLFKFYDSTSIGLWIMNFLLFSGIDSELTHEKNAPHPGTDLSIHPSRDFFAACYSEEFTAFLHQSVLITEQILIYCSVKCPLLIMRPVRTSWAQRLIM